MLKNPFNFGKKASKCTAAPKERDCGVNFIMYAKEFDVTDVNVIKYSTNAQNVKHSCMTTKTKEDGVISILVQGTIDEDKNMFLPREAQGVKQCHISKTLNIEKNGHEMIVKINFGEDGEKLNVNGEFNMVIGIPENMDVTPMFRP